MHEQCKYFNVCFIFMPLTVFSSSRLAVVLDGASDLSEHTTAASLRLSQPCPLVAAARHHSDLQLLASASEGAAIGLAMSSHGGRLSC